MIGAARCNQSQPNASGRERIWRRGPDTRQAQFDRRGLGPAVWWNHTKLTAPRVATPPLERVGGPLAWWQATLDHREDPGLNPLGARTSIVNSDRAKSRPWRGRGRRRAPRLRTGRSQTSVVFWALPASPKLLESEAATAEVLYVLDQPPASDRPGRRQRGSAIPQRPALPPSSSLAPWFGELTHDAFPRQQSIAKGEPSQPRSR